MNADQTGGAAVNEPKAGTHNVPQITQFVTDLMSARDGVHPHQTGERGGVDLIGLDLRIRDGLQVFCVGEHQLDAVGGKKVIEPIPARGAFDHGAMGTGEFGKVAEHRRGLAWNAALCDDLSCSINRCDESVIFVQIDP